MKLLFGLLSPAMEKSGFACGEAALDTYLQKLASQDMKRGFATVIVARTETDPKKIIGYYTLSAASVLLDNVPEEMARNMPRYPNIPAVRLGRLAVASGMQGQHIGSLLVLDALRRSCLNELAWALFLVDAKNERVAAFYEKFLFQRFADNTLHLWMHRKQAENLITQIPA
ncbi:GNAT family N-acetyltransferase [Desulfovibrio sp. ZJ369]|uniref:GNAT family N-acetyltransferase n=1 Tax=Desulfovibrio sp. ZJ369 TaxID=2709793 RepID=UPI0013EACB26|nr:GNAT family N-acetyltransferase [Desulfovibrio sp. ZJ369]